MQKLKKQNAKITEIVPTRTGISENRTSQKRGSG